MFSTSRKQAQQTAQRLLSGHCALIAWWALRQAGILEAMKNSKEGLSPLVHATRTSMAPEVLEAFLDYLAAAGLVAMKKDGAHLTADGHALFEHEDGVLQLVRAYQPVLDMAEHLLAKLKTYAPPGTGAATGGSGAGAGGGGGAASSGTVYRKAEYLIESQVKRFATEVFPAVSEMVAKQKFSHLLDVTCGSGDLLIHIAQQHKKVVGVGIGADSASVRRANTAITTADLETRLIAVTANSLDACIDTQRTFDRIGISRQLWKSLDCVVAINLFSELPLKKPDDPDPLHRTLAAIAKNFPTAHLLFIEPVASARFERNYYAPELSLLLRLAHAAPWPPEKWRDALRAAKFTLLQEAPLSTDGLCIFLCKPT